MSYPTWKEKPLHVKTLILFFFPIYGTVRLGCRIIQDTTVKIWKLIFHVLDGCEEVYISCKNHVKKFWCRIVVPYLWNPIKGVVERVFTCVANTYKSLAEGLSTLWETIWK